jgi:putative tricarboxylic transport membrane protein
MSSRHGIIAAALVLAAVSSPVHAQAFTPSKPIEFVTHTGPGGGGDVMARQISAGMEKEKLLPVRMTVANKTGGGGATGMAYMAEKKGEPHTIAVFTGIWYTLPLMRSEARVTMKDLTPLARLVLEPAMVAVKSDSPHKTLGDFIEAARKSPGQLKQSAGSIGSRDWLVRQLLMTKTGTNWVYISFPGGGERFAALLGGHVQMMVVEPPEVGEHIRSGNIRVIATIAEKRLPAFPNVPTVQEAGFDIPNVPQVRGIVGPPGLSKEAVAYWENVFARFVKTESWKKIVDDNMWDSSFMGSAALIKFGDEYSATTRSILTAGGVKVAR